MPATPWAATAANSALPSVAMAGTATTSSPGRRIRRSASRRLTSGCDSNERPSWCSRSNARNAAGWPGSPASRRSSSRGSARPVPSTTTSSPSRIADRAATRTAIPANSGSAADTSRPAASTIRTSPSPGCIAGPMYANARTPPHHGSNRCSSESNGSGSRRGSIGRRSGRSGSRSVSSRKVSWSGMARRW